LTNKQKKKKKKKKKKCLTKLLVFFEKKIIGLFEKISPCLPNPHSHGPTMLMS
jgi:hypothetical protein